ncbi:MAG: hypothetical protein HY241_15705 [Actinobacteria bacterium]|nr:hypothetical protein [Actinomycetota bacterium]
MARFVVELRYLDPDRRTEVRPQHLVYVRDLAARGSVVSAGPWADGTGSLTIYDTATEDHVRRLVADDPYTVAGVVELVSLREWTPVVHREL